MKLPTPRMSAVLIAAVLLLAAGAGWFLRDKDADPIVWQRLASPGALTSAHASLEKDCATCHTPVSGPDDAKCIGCHANETALLQRQPTAFHADIGNCTQCHVEHRGRQADLRAMDHTALARLGLARTRAQAGGADLAAQIAHWIDAHPGGSAATPRHPATSPLEATLACSTCHATAQPHNGLFGEDCATCHATDQWTVAYFRHPSPASTDCAQCHQAPPSHYMMHFEMVSKRAAKPAPGPMRSPEHTTVEQCYVCHETTSWNDIEGLGWYKHH